MKPARLSVVDDMFYRGHHGRGVEVVMQGVWRFSDQLTPADVESFHAMLVTSSLTRRVISPRVPWARRYFASDAVVAPLRVHATPIDPTGVVAWADECARTHLDVDVGPAWEMSLARIDGGGSLVSLTCSHLVSDGLGLVAEADTASGGSPRPARPRATSTPTSRPRLRDDIADAVGLWALVIVGIVRSLWRGCVDRAVRAELFAALRPAAADTPTKPTSPTGRETTAMVAIDAEEWDRHVSRAGATSTAAVVAVAADIVVELRGPGPVDIAVPMADGTGQSLMMAEVRVDDDAGPATCAADLRVAYARAGSGSGLGPPGGMPAELLQLLGDRLAHALVPDPGGREGLVSPLGDLGTGFDELDGHRSTGMAVRSAYPRSGTGGTRSSTLLGVWSARACGRVVLSLVASDDPAGRSLADIPVASLASRGVHATAW